MRLPRSTISVACLYVLLLVLTNGGCAIQSVTNFFIVVHAMTPAFAGVIAHLLDVSLRTPAIKNHLDLPVGVVQLGDADLSSPLASLVVSEVSEIPKFDLRLHLGKSLCVLTLSGCDQDVLEKSGLRVGSVPVVSLQKLASKKNSLMQMPNLTINELIKVGSDHPAEAKNICDSKIADCGTDLSDTAFLIADCVSLLVHTLVQSSELEKTLRAD